MDFSNENITIDELLATGGQEEQEVVAEPCDDDRLGVLGDVSSLTDAQKDAVLKPGRILVSAAAGSGKTSTMVKRISLLVAEGASLRETLILVYNDAAAAELKEKLRNELYLGALNNVGEVRERYRRELDRLGFCKIGTIHSFCQTLIRENFEKLNLSPTFKVLDEMQHAAYMSKALDAVFDEFSQNDEKFLDLAEIFSMGRKDENLKNTVKKLFGLIDIQPDREDFLETVKSCYSSFENSKFFDELARLYKIKFAEVLKYLKECDAKLCDLIAFDPCYELYSEKVKQKYCDCYKDFSVAVKLAAEGVERLCDVNGFSALAEAAGAFKMPTTKKRPSLDTMSDEGKNCTDVATKLFKAVKGYVNQLVEIDGKLSYYEDGHAQNAVYVDKLVQLTLSFADKLQQLKDADNVLSFEDLQKQAVKLLKNYPETGEGYTAVFVDEYQDVNPMQEFIITKLIKGDCFMVGDVKQSIYGFRLADPKIFLSRQRYYSEGGGIAIDFNRNFRSSKRILSFVNCVFDAVMTKESADVDYKNTARFDIDGNPDGTAVVIKLFETPKESRKYAGGTLYDIEAHPDDGDGESSYAEGKYIAETIKSLVGKAVAGDRYMRYGDIAVLFRSRTAKARIIVETLANSGIPIEAAGFGDKSSQPEREIVNFLKVIDNPAQDIPLAGYLLSFFGGYGEDELAAISSYAGDCLWDKLRMASADRGALAKKVAATLDTLEEYRTKAGFKNVSELMSGIASDYLYDAYLARRGDSEIQGLRQFIASSSGFDGSLGKFLEEYSATGQKPSGGGNGDRVHISTFHGFKGLEVPVVFVSDLANSFNRRDKMSDLLTFGKGYIGLSRYNLFDRTKSDALSRTAISNLMDENSNKEEMRLLYVALTRAKQMMYLTATVSAAKSQTFGKSPALGGAGCDLDFISNAVYINGVDALVDIEVADMTPSAVSVRGATIADPAIVDEVKKFRQFEYPYAASTKLAMKYSVSALDSIDIDDDGVSVFAESAAEGTAYHKVMQNIDFSTRGEDAVNAELDRMVSENSISQEERATIDARAIAACLESDVMQAALKAEVDGRCFREQPFMMYKPANEVSENFMSDDKVLVQGIIDLFIDGEQRVIVDFKNSYLKDAESLKRYEKQLKLYKMAVESATSAKVDKIALYSFKTGKTIYFD